MELCLLCLVVVSAELQHSSHQPSLQPIPTLPVPRGWRGITESPKPALTSSILLSVLTLESGMNYASKWAFFCVLWNSSLRFVWIWNFIQHLLPHSVPVSFPITPRPVCLRFNDTSCIPACVSVCDWWRSWEMILEMLRNAYFCAERWGEASCSPAAPAHSVPRVSILEVSFGMGCLGRAVVGL